MATREISIGDNDTLAARVAVETEAELLILMSDIDGLYTSDPHKDPEAKLISRVTELTPQILALGGGQGSSLGTGGMSTKLTAAGIVMQAGTNMLIVNGADPNILYDVIEGKAVGTLFTGGEKR